MRYTIKEVQKALEIVTKNGGPSEIDITIDPMERLVLSYVDTLGGDQITITIFRSDISKMATITKTTRL